MQAALQQVQAPAGTKAQEGSSTPKLSSAAERKPPKLGSRIPKKPTVEPLDSNPKTLPVPTDDLEGSGTRSEHQPIRRTLSDYDTEEVPDPVPIPDFDDDEVEEGGSTEPVADSDIEQSVKAGGMKPPAVHQPIHREGRKAPEKLRAGAKADPAKGKPTEDLSDWPMPTLTGLGFTINQDGNILNKDNEIVGQIFKNSAGDTAGDAVDTSVDIDDENADMARSVEDAQDEPGNVGPHLEDHLQVEPQDDSQRIDIQIGDFRFGAPGVSFSVSGMTVNIDNTSGLVKQIMNHVIGIQGSNTDHLPSDHIPPLPDLAPLEGLRVGAGGEVIGPDGIALGRMEAPDPVDPPGHQMTVDGEPLGENGNMIGRAEIEPQTARIPGDRERGSHLDHESPAGNRRVHPDSSVRKISALSERLSEDEGVIYRDDDQVLGVLVAGEAHVCKSRSPNSQGDILDEAGRLIGKIATVKSDGVAEWIDDEESPSALRTPPKPLPELCDLLAADMRNTLKAHFFEGDKNDIAMQLDNSFLMLKHWQSEIAFKGTDTLAPLDLADVRHPYLARADRFLMTDVLNRVKRMEELLSIGGSLYNNQLEGLSKRIGRGCQLLTDRTEFYRNFLDLYQVRGKGEIRELHAQMEAYEAKLRDGCSASDLL